MLGYKRMEQRQARANFSFEFSIESKWKSNIHQKNSIIIKIATPKKNTNKKRTQAMFNV